MPKSVGLLFAGLLVTVLLRAQDTLPRFTAAARGPGKILVSWHNRYPVVSQISIQRSPDSLKNFTTLITVQDPKLPENGAVDSKADHPNYYYRLFVVLDNGKYFFTASKRPVSNTGVTPAAVEADKAEEASAGVPADNRLLYMAPDGDKGKPRFSPPVAIHQLPELSLSNTVFVRKGDSLLGPLVGARIQTYRDSILRHTRDTLIFIDGDTLLIRPFIAKEVYKASPYVYTGKYGNIHVMLPEAAKKHFAVKFFDEDKKLLFELSEIRDSALIVDKTNFHHYGWFYFELYDGDQLKEKNKFYIPKEF
ncbi:MAG TPA: hypothetical protein VNU70_08395 [Puia sp.]|jgi:hypothetical protein|nr:hypothetical protein [Puia sp.]